MVTGKFYRFINKSVLLIILLSYLNSCFENKSYSKIIKINDACFNGEVKVEKIEKINKYKLSIVNSTTGICNGIYTPYEIFQLETGDVNFDGKTDICIGIIKPTPFDSALKKRLFIFQIDRDYIRPLWLSSRLVRTLEEFVVCKNNEGQCSIRTIERQNKNMYCINEYRWESFGMSFIKELKDSLSYSKAHVLLNNFKMNQ
jgi:hypothetical protein